MSDEVQHFIDSAPADRRPLLDHLRALIERLYPDGEWKLSYGVPTYRTKSGWVGLGYWKGGVSLYTNGGHNLVAFKAAHARIKTGTGTVNLTITDDVPDEALAGVVHSAMK